MSFDPDDPRLTALVLGELDDQERAAFEAELAKDPDAARELEDIALLAALLSDELGAEGGDGLDPAQHDAIERAMRAAPLLDADSAETTAEAADAPANDDRPRQDDRPDNVLPLWERPGARALAAAAAVMVVVLGAVALPLGSRDDAPVEVAMAPAAESNDRDLRQPAIADPNSQEAVIDEESPALMPPANADTPGQLAQDRGVVAPAVVVTSAPLGAAVTEATPTEAPSTTTPTETLKTEQFAKNSGSTHTISPRAQGQRGPVLSVNAEPTGATNGTPAEAQARKQLEALGYLGDADVDGRVGLLAPDAPSQDNERLTGQDNGRYVNAEANPFKSVTSDPLSTLSIDVDTASYANVRRHLNSGQLPPAGAVRVEEMINYFDYGYAPPRGEHPFAAHVEVGRSPWDAQRRLVRVGIKAREVAQDQRPASNLVFLIDVSGSMSAPNKLPLLVDAMGLLVAQLDRRDRVAIVVYAGSEGVALPPTPGDQRAAILGALKRLQSGGSTNGAAGIQRAYQLAADSFIQGGVNRVILATDGDFNVGLTSRDALTQLIQHKARSGVFLSVLGFGMGDYNDATLETLADKGNGNYAYIETINEARKVLVNDLTGTLVTVAKDVKIQVEFNPNRVASYRLVGYTNRLLAARDFNDDTKDAGEIGAGHTVTALYEVTPVEHLQPGVDPLKYQRKSDLTPAGDSLELLNVKLRYKPPTSDTSVLVEFPVQDADRALEDTSADMRLAAAVAMFGQLLRRDPSAATTRYADALRLASAAARDDRHGYRAELLGLIQRAAALDPSRR